MGRAAAIAALAASAAAQAVGPVTPRWQLDVAASGLTSLDLRGTTNADDLATVPFYHDSDQVQILTPGVFAVNPLIGGTSYGAALYVHSVDAGIPTIAEALARPSLLIYGVDTNTITIVWTNYSSTWARADGYLADATTNTPFSLDFYVTDVGGSTPIRYFTQYYVYSKVYTEHETDGIVIDPFEDPAYVRQANLFIDGQNVTFDRFDLDAQNQDLDVYREYLSPVLVQDTTVGTRKLLEVTGETYAEILTQGQPAGAPFFLPEDNSFAVWYGVVRIEFDLGLGAPPENLLDPEGPPSLITYSLDIGSDSELSDPVANGNEAWDPGDVYVFGAPNPPPGIDGAWDDERLNASLFDPYPSPPAGSTPGAPVCTGPPPGGIVPPLFMDLDGHQLVDVDLSAVIPAGAPLASSIPRFATDAIFDAWHVVVSYEDDGTDAHTACDLPVNTPSASGATHGSVVHQDESVALELDRFSVPTVVLSESSLWHEGHFSRDLVPMPDAFDPLDLRDDDVDALSMVDVDPITCPWLLFTVDHEAPSGPDPTNPVPIHWDPGSILMAQSTPGCGTLLPFVLVDELVHLGLLPGADVDAFELAWAWDASVGRDGLALLFSVDEDDPATVPDESGGLDPRMIYLSFMTGSSVSMLDHPLRDDVDAIAVSRNRPRGRSVVASFCDEYDGSHASCPCGASDPEAGCDIAQGPGVRADVLAQLFAPNQATIQGVGYPPATTPTAIVIRANNLSSVPVQFGDGLRCVGLTGFARLAATSAVGGASTHAFSHAAAPGSYFYQLWFRNSPVSYCVTTGPAFGAFNLSNGRILTW